MIEYKKIPHRGLCAQRHRGNQGVRALIVTPTRELAIQIQQVEQFCVGLPHACPSCDDKKFAVWLRWFDCPFL